MTIPFQHDVYVDGAAGGTAITAAKMNRAGVELDALDTLLLYPTGTKTAAYTAAVKDNVLCDATSGAFTVTLPSAPADGSQVSVKKVDSTSNAVTVACAGTDTFVIGGTSLTLAVQGHAVTWRYQASSGKWTGVSNDLPLAQADARYARVNLPGGFVTPGTRRAQLALSCAGQANGGALTDFHQRLLVQVPVNTTRWRLRMVNAHADGTGIVGALNISGVYLGTPALAANTGMPSGAFTAAPTLALGAFSLDPNGAADTVTPWVTDPTLQFAAGKSSMMSMGWTTAATATAVGCGSMWYTLAHGDAAVAAPALSYATGPRAAFRIEYEFVGSNSIGIAVGDSLTEGYYADGTGTDLLPATRLWHQLAAQRNGSPMCMAGFFGSTTSQWLSTTAAVYQEWANSGLTIDYAIVDLGSNDAANSVALATYQANMGTIIGNLRSLGIPNVFVATIAPRSLTGTAETQRLAFNKWLRTHPYDVQGVLDMDNLLAVSIGGSTLQTGYGATDNTHWTPVGHHIASLAVPGRLVAAT